MWLGEHTLLSLLGLFIQSMFIGNLILAYFLGMCTYLACSAKLKTAHGLGIAVIVVMTISGLLNFFVHKFITGPNALAWLGLDIDLGFLEFILFISVIAAFVQIAEILIEHFLPPLYNALGIYLPLITVNCAILGVSLFSVTRDFAFIPNLVYLLGSGFGWYLAIVLIASIREKLASNDIPGPFKGIGITFIASGLMAMAFMGLGGIKLDEPPKETVSEQEVAHTP